MTRIFAAESEAQGAMLEELWATHPNETPPEAGELADQWDEAVKLMKDFRRERDKKLEELLGEERYKKFKKLTDKTRRPKS